MNGFFAGCTGERRIVRFAQKEQIEIEVPVPAGQLVGRKAMEKRSAFQCNALCRMLQEHQGSLQDAIAFVILPFCRQSVPSERKKKTSVSFTIHPVHHLEISFLNPSSIVTFAAETYLHEKTHLSFFPSFVFPCRSCAKRKTSRNGQHGFTSFLHCKVPPRRTFPRWTQCSGCRQLRK